MPFSLYLYEKGCYLLTEAVTINQNSWFLFLVLQLILPVAIPSLDCSSSHVKMKAETCVLGCESVDAKHCEVLGKKALCVYSVYH